MDEPKRKVLEPGQVLQIIENKKDEGRLKNYLKIILEAKDKLNEYTTVLKDLVSSRCLDNQLVDEAFSVIAKMEMLTGSRMKVYAEKLESTVNDVNGNPEPYFYFRSDLFNDRFIELMDEITQLENNFYKLKPNPEKNSEQASKKSVSEKSSKQVVGESLEKVSQELLKQVSENSGEQAVEKTLKEVSQKSLKQVSENSGEQAVEKTLKEVSQKSLKKVSENSGEQAVEKTLKEVSQKSIKQVSENSGEQAVEKTLEETSEKPLEKASEKSLHMDK